MVRSGVLTGTYRPAPSRFTPLKEVSLAHKEMEKDFELVRAFIEANWTTEIAGKTEGYKDRASASACGKGMLRAALRNLTRFYDRLERLEENGPQDAKLKPIADVLDMADRWRRAGWKNQARGKVYREAA